MHLFGCPRRLPLPSQPLTPTNPTPTPAPFPHPGCNTAGKASLVLTFVFLLGLLVGGFLVK